MNLDHDIEAASRWLDAAARLCNVAFVLAAVNFALLLSVWPSIPIVLLASPIVLSTISFGIGCYGGRISGS